MPVKPYQVVLDTNVLVTAARSRRGTSYALLRTLRAGQWQMNISPALFLEYEAQLKIEAMRQNRPLAAVDRFLDLLARISIRREVYFLLRPFLRDSKDDFIIELAVASRADYLVTWNVRDFAGAEEYGIAVMRPNEFLAMLENPS
jgi:putative PIN family toxin of toxin-antitoxin system